MVVANVANVAIVAIVARALRVRQRAVGVATQQEAPM